MSEGPRRRSGGCAGNTRRNRGATEQMPWRNYEGWELAGGVWTAERAHHKYKEILADYKKPAMDAATHEELRTFVDWRVSEGGAPTDF